MIVLSGKSLGDAEKLRGRLLADPALAQAIDGQPLGLSIGIHEAHDGDARAILSAVDQNMYDDKTLHMEQHLEDMPTALEDALEDD